MDKVIRCCPVCGGNDFSEFAQEKIDYDAIGDFTYSSRKIPEFMCLRLVHCNTCDLVYAPEPPTEEFLEKVYSTADYDSSDEANYASRTYGRELSPFVNKMANKTLAVEVGAGNGSFITWLIQQGFDKVIGVEPSTSAVMSAPQEIRPFLHNKMYSSDIVQGKSISLVCSFMTLEHIEDPLKFVSSVFPNMSDGSMIAFVVHNRRAVLNRILGMKSPIIDIEHLQLFSPESARFLLTKSGFKKVKIKSFSNTYPIKYWVRLLPLPNRIKSIMISFLKFIRMDTYEITLPVGNMLVVGYKVD